MKTYTTKLKLTLSQKVAVTQELKGERKFQLTLQDDLTDEQRQEFAFRHAATRYRNQRALIPEWPAENGSSITVKMSDVYFVDRKHPATPEQIANRAVTAITSITDPALLEQIMAQLQAVKDAKMAKMLGHADE